MVQKVIINDVTIPVEHFDDEVVSDQKTGCELHKISLKFKVSSQDYHEITTLLYANDFEVNIPEKELVFPATINSYATSITNLYKENTVGDFKLELMEKRSV